MGWMTRIFLEEAQIEELEGSDLYEELFDIYDDQYESASETDAIDWTEVEF
jgi:hypothetical protein